ncbi:hypothetical protein Vretifemale_7782, partial [Volvox reticuliferus]
ASWWTVSPQRQSRSRGSTAGAAAIVLALRQQAGVWAFQKWKGRGSAVRALRHGSRGSRDPLAAAPCAPPVGPWLNPIATSPLRIHSLPPLAVSPVAAPAAA